MKVFNPRLLILLIITTGANADTNDTAFFRISSPSNGVITELYPAEGTISWSNGVAGVTNQLQRSIDLTATNGWVDFVMLVSTGATASTERIIDLDPPTGMVLIPGGMNCGTNPLAAGEVYDESYPSNYDLSVSAFYMDATEVTKAQWDVVYNWAIAHDYSFSNSGSGRGTDHPVHTVNWYDCVKWCNARSQMEGKTPCYTVEGGIYKTSTPTCNFNANGYRLPTSDEWEYAARGGLKSKRFPWGDTITHSEANYVSISSYSYDTSPTRGHHPDYDEWDGDPHTSPAGSFAATGYGLYDMSGNVWEWCTDWHPDSVGSNRVVRGGGWDIYAIYARCGNVFRYLPINSGYFLGFRTVLPAK